MSGWPTDHRNSNLLELNREVIRGKANGKIIWQPRIGCWYTDKMFQEGKLPEPYNGMKPVVIYRELGCSARIYDYSTCFKKINHPEVKCNTIVHSGNIIEDVMDTPIGKINQIIEKPSSSWYYIVIKRWITNEEDMKVACWIEENCTWKWDGQEYERIYSEWENLGLPAICMPRVNIQNLYIDMMGIENTVYALSDYPDTVEQYFKVLDDSHKRLIKVINESPIEFVNFGDNLHAGTLSPELFRKYVLPAYRTRNELLHEAGKFTCSHWDGDTKSLLPFAKECGLDGIEAITPYPQGDVTLEEVKEALGDEVFLIDGIAAVLFDEIYPVEELEAQVRKVIELFAPRLILGISDEISSSGDMERVKLVGKMVDEYNAAVIMR